MKYEHLKQQDDFVYTEVFDWNVYQALPEEIHNQNILDIGGHYGMFNLFCNEYNPKQIITVEASPVNFVKLLNNTKNIRNLKAINAAVTTKTGDFITISNDGCQSQINKGNTTVSTVSLVDVVDWFPDNEDIVLKMDIEGAEYPLFFDSPSFIFKRFNRIYIELHEESIAGPGNTIKRLNTFIQNELRFKSVWEGRFFTNTDTGKHLNNDIAVFKYERVS